MTSQDWLTLSSRLYLLAIIVGAGASWGVYRFGSEVSDQKDKQVAAAAAAAAKATERAAALEEGAEKLRKANAELSIELERERSSRIKLQDALSSRHITPEKAAKIADAIRGKVSSVVLQYTSDAESVSFAHDIRNALALGGVQVRIEFAGIMSPTPYGLQMSVPETAKSLAQAFVDQGFNPSVRTAAGGAPVILVGHKPPPF